MKNIHNFIFMFLLFVSCTTTNVAKEEKKTVELPFTVTKHFVLDNKLNEISGLLIDGDYFWGFNDSGGEPEIYLFRKEKPQILKTVRFTNVKNNDFEIITENDSLIFVGDTGNNRGNRKDLKFLYFNKKILNEKLYQEIEVDTLSFFYPEQKDYTKQNHTHNFDLEGAFFSEGKLHLFTKQWVNLKTRHFTLDLVHGSQPAWLKEEYDIQFLVTDAAVTYQGEQKRMAWVGYNTDGQAYLLITTIDKKEDYFFNGAKEKFSLGFGGNLGQIEGVSFKSWNEVCYSAEAYNYSGEKFDQNVTCLKLKD